MTGRTYSNELVEQLLNRLASGKESLAAICTDKNMPALRTVYDWIEADAEFFARFRVHKAIGVRAMVDDCVEIADEPVAQGDSTAVANKRVRIDTRLRLAGKWLREEFGDKVDIHTKTEVTHRHDLSGYSADELDALEKLISKAPHVKGDTSGKGQPVSTVVH
jgi:hypothetical protein